MYKIPANAAVGGLGGAPGGGGATAWTVVDKKTSVEPKTRGKILGNLPILYDLVTGDDNLDLDYIDVHEEMGGGELLIVYHSNDREISVVPIRSTRGNIVVNIGKYGPMANILRFRLGNWVQDPKGHRVSLPNDVAYLYEDLSKLAASAKNVSGINHKIFQDPRVYNRWIGVDYNVSRKHLEKLLNVFDNRLFIRREGINLVDIPFEIDSVGKWLLACLIIRGRRRGSSINLRLLYEKKCIHSYK